MSIDRRKLLQGGAVLAAGAVLSTPFVRRAQAQGAAMTFTPEQGASLRLLRWVPFVKGEEEAWNANTQAFTEATGVAVTIDQESWEDVRPKAAVAANVGTGHDMVMSWFDDPFQYPDKLVDVTDLPQGIAHGPGKMREDTLRDRERAEILNAVAQCGGNMTETARRLGISRSTLYLKLEQYGVPRGRRH